MRKYLVRIGLGIGAVAAIAFLVMWIQASRADAELAVLKVENDAKRQEIDKLLGQVQAANDALLASNVALREANRALVEKDRQIQAKERQLVAERDRRVAETAKLTPPERAKQTAAELSLPETEIIPNQSGYLFTETAAQKNLEQLILRGSAVQELALSRERIGLLEQQNANLRTESDQLNQVIQNNAVAHKAELDRVGLTVQEKDKEISALKAKIRKRTAVATIVGFIAGVVVRAVLL